MTQDSFADAVFQAGKIADHPRLSVYANGVTKSLISVLEAGFPVIRQLVGSAFFAEMALIFVRSHPPKSRMMMLYSTEFAVFLQDFPPVATLPYLPDMARLEQALRESYHAADALPMDPDALSGMTETHRLHFAPSLRIVRSTWPILAVWRAHVGGIAPNGPADVVILRPGFDPAPHALPIGGATLLEALLSGATLGHALSISPPELDLAAVLTLLLNEKALIGLSQ